MKTFKEYLRAAIEDSHTAKRPLGPGECQSPRSIRCTLCNAVNLNYDDELKIKEEAIRSFLRKSIQVHDISQLVPSPRGRCYRTVTKRRVFRQRSSVRLGLIAPADDGSFKPFDVVRCAIEPEGHAGIYSRIQEILEKPYARPLAEVLSYVIIKGSYTEHTVILNVRHVSQQVIGATNTLSKSLTHSFEEITAVFLYEDSSDGRYYLGSARSHSSKLKRVFGKKEIYHRILGKSFLYSPLSFSQINMSLVDPFVSKAGELLELTKGATLYDLYSGYGMFALCLSDKVEAVVGIDVEMESISSAMANAKRQRATNVRFRRSDITSETISRLMTRAHREDGVLLDPPRSGTAEGVIECIAARRPARVVHIFCNIDIMPAELKRWEKSDYTISRVIPFDMFPGTATVETMVLLRPR